MGLLTHGQNQDEHIKQHQRHLKSLLLRNYLLHYRFRHPLHQVSHKREFRHQSPQSHSLKQQQLEKTLFRKYYAHMHVQSLARHRILLRTQSLDLVFRSYNVHQNLFCDLQHPLQRQSLLLLICLIMFRKQRIHNYSLLVYHESPKRFPYKYLNAHLPLVQLF